MVINSPVPGTVAPVPGVKVRVPAKPTPVLGTNLKTNWVEEDEMVLGVTRNVSFYPLFSLSSRRNLLFLSKHCPVGQPVVFYSYLPATKRRP